MDNHSRQLAALPHMFKTLINNLSEKNIPFFELRHKASEENALYSGDIDFFTSSIHLDSILLEIFQLAALHGFWIVIDRKKQIKTKVILIDTTHKMITLEIWTCLEVKDPFRASLNYIFWEDFERVFLGGDSLSAKLPLDFETLYYLSHLCTKKKKLENTEVASRISYYKNKLEQTGLSGILRLYSDLSNDSIQSTGHEANQRLVKLGVLRKRTFRSLFPEIKLKYQTRTHRLKTFFLRLIKFIPVVGPDGVGKTTTINMMVRENKRFRYYRFKKTFRKSILYKLTHPFFKRTAAKRMNDGELAKNQVDDHYGHVIFYISRLRYTIFILFNLLTGKVRFSDRFFHDFLFENLRFKHETSELRKNWPALLKKIPASYLMIQLNAPPEIITSRKDELSEEDITFYRDGIFSFYLKKPSILYYCIDTSADLDQSGELYHFLANYF